MIIQKSPHHISSSNKIINTNVNEKSSQQLDLVKEESDKFSFWSWFKGLVNPLQNLPIISGIYSSVTSENEESDRDLVQNSLGGFLYGGPIGAIVGFGNWAFNKIFDKTPTEMALDASGISEIWKDNGENENKQLANSNKPSMGDDLKLHIQYASGNSIVTPSKNINLKTLNQQKLVLSSDSNIKDNKIILDEGKINTPVKKSEENITKGLNLVFEESFNKEQKFEKNSSNIDKENTTKFREINFSYPAWKPEKKIIPGKKIEYLKKEYEKLGRDGLKNELRVDA